MNDHRTFLPYIGLVIATAGAAALLVNRKSAYSVAAKIAAICTVVVFLCANAYHFPKEQSLENRRNALARCRVGRGLMNYGNTLMAKGDFAGALDYFHRAEQLTPQYSVLLINLAIAEDATKQSAAAEQHFKDALRLAPASPDSYTYYARYLLSHSRAQEPRAFLRSALELSPTDLTARELMPQTDGRAINEPTIQTPESYLVLSLEFYGEEHYVESIVACRRALDLRPGYAEAWNNIGAVYNKLGRYEEAAAACEQALRYKPDFELARNNLQYAREKLKAPTK
jgi:protein O-mannosyl-transferase